MARRLITIDVFVVIIRQNDSFQLNTCLYSACQELFYHIEERF